MVKTSEQRASGMTAAEEEAKEGGEAIDQSLDDAVLPEEREKQFRTPGFRRMKFVWGQEDAVIIQRAKDAAADRLVHEFTDAYEVINDIYEIVRKPEVDAQGEPKRDRHGFVVWKRNPGGGYDEDFAEMSKKQQEHFMFLLTTRLFDWEQRSTDAWLEAMMAKAQWEERFAIDFDAGMSGTVDDRRARGNLGARDERYFAIFATAYSRKTEALVRSMQALAQRLKDAMTA